jgi:hypothetical protein
MSDGWRPLIIRRQKEEKRPRAVEAVERHELIFTLEASARSRIKDQKKRGNPERTEKRHQKNLCEITKWVRLD